MIVHEDPARLKPGDPDSAKGSNSHLAHATLSPRRRAMVRRTCLCALTVIAPYRPRAFSALPPPGHRDLRRLIPWRIQSSASEKAHKPPGTAEGAEFFSQAPRLLVGGPPPSINELLRARDGLHRARDSQCELNLRIHACSLHVLAFSLLVATS